MRSVQTLYLDLLLIIDFDLNSLQLSLLRACLKALSPNQMEYETEKIVNWKIECALLCCCCLIHMAQILHHTCLFLTFYYSLSVVLLSPKVMNYRQHVGDIVSSLSA